MADQRAELVRKMIAEGTSDDDIRATLKVYDAQQAAAPKAASGGVLQTAKDVGIGALKGLGSTVSGLGEMAVNAGAIPGVAPSMFNPDMRNPIFRKTDELTTASNTPQRVGKVGEQIAEMALPAAAGANAVPRMSRASGNLEKVLSLAKDVPLDMQTPGNAALRIQELASRGGTEPRAVTKLVRRVTDPSQAPMNFGEGRDWYSNISRLSADEYNRLTPVIQREVGNLRQAFHGALQGAADTVGQGQTYANAIKEYAKAAQLSSYRDELLKALMKGAAPFAGGAAGAGAATWLGQKLRGLVSD